MQHSLCRERLAMRRPAVPAMCGAARQRGRPRARIRRRMRRRRVTAHVEEYPARDRDEASDAAPEHRALAWTAAAAIVIIFWVVRPIALGLLIRTLLAFITQPAFDRLKHHLRDPTATRTRRGQGSQPRDIRGPVRRRRGLRPPGHPRWPRAHGAVDCRVAPVCVGSSRPPSFRSRGDSGRRPAVMFGAVSRCRESDRSRTSQITPSHARTRNV